MRFYDREEQLETLREMRELSYNGYSRLTVVTGRRRIGKTTLIKEAYRDEPYVYLFVGKKSEFVLCGEFCEEFQEKIGVFVPQMSAFRDLFRYGCQRFCLFPNGETFQRQERTPLRKRGLNHQTTGIPHFNPQTNHGG